MKKTVSLALVVLMIAAMFSAFALASSADDGYTFADGVLTVKADIECNTEEYPWHANRAEVTKVVVADGVTKVGHHAFTQMENLTEITFGKDATVFGNDAFSGCPNLKTVTFNAPVTSIGQGIAYNSKAIETVNLYNQSEEAFKTLAAVKAYNLASNGGISTGFDTCTYVVKGNVSDEVIKLEVAPSPFGQYENWPANETAKTWFLVGGTTKAITDKLTGEGKTLNMKVTIVDETEGKTYVIPKYFFDTPAREIYSDTNGNNFVRIAVCEYGIIPDATHAYTVSLEFSDVATGKVKYAGTSAVGAFNKPSASFTEPIIPDPIPHPLAPEQVVPPTGDTTAVIVVLAVVAMIGTALVVSKKVLAK